MYGKNREGKALNFNYDNNGGPIKMVLLNSETYTRWTGLSHLAGVPRG